MRTTVDLDDELLAEAQKAIGAKTKTELLEMGLRELLHKAASRELLRLEGRLPNIKVVPRRRTKER